MLARAGQNHARPRISQHALHSFNQLLLPWLCPAIATAAEQRQYFTNKTKPSPSPRPSQISQRPTEHTAPARKLATAAEVPQYAVPDEHIPFEGLHHAPDRLYPKVWDDSSLSNIKPFHNANIIVSPIATIAPVPSMKGSGLYGMPSDVADLQQNLYACVRVGRLDRAAALARRITDIHVPTAPEVQDATTRYLIGCLNAIEKAPSREKLTTMQKWLEIDIKAKGVPFTAEMLSTMIKATFVVLDGTRRERSIRRYLGYARDAGLEADVNSSSIFTEAEWASLLRLQPQHFLPLPEHVGVEEDSADNAPVSSQHDGQANLHDELEPKVDERGIEFRSIDQRGLGMRALKNSLTSMAPETPHSNDPIETEDLVSRQMRLEQDVMSSAISRWQEEYESNVAASGAQGLLSDAKLGAHIHKWLLEMQALLKKEIKFGEQAEKKEELTTGQSDRIAISPYLHMCAPERLCATALTSFLQTIGTPLGSSRSFKELDNKDATSLQRSVASLVTRIGNEVSREINIESVKKAAEKEMAHLPSPERKKRLSRLLKHQSSVPLSRQNSAAAILSTTDTNNAQDPSLPPWSIPIRAKLGALFLSFLIKVAKIPVTKKDLRTGREVTQLQPIASHGSKYTNGKRVGVIKTNVELLKRMQKEPVVSRISKHLPMISKPRKWESVDEGAYLTSKTSAIRFKDSSASQKVYIRMADKRGDMIQTYAGLDALSQVPWRINKEILKVQAELWNTGEAIAQFAPENPIAEFPPEPPRTDYRAHHRWKDLVKSINNEVTGFHSQRCYQNFQLEVARAYMDDIFYTPHNIDFRGRAYPIPPYFNHMGQDFVRGLFLFAQGKELGETGIVWLKIHLANTYGFDKHSLRDRENFANDHLSDIYDSAENPVHGDRWWIKAEDPWQCLAACMELRNALDSPVPSQYVSSLPIQQDGTCNGLQHYAALGGDEIGARQVNLAPGDRPADIYSAVAEMVKEDVEKDAIAGNQKAVLLQDKISRKIVKQPVMTNVYGVTFHGAKAQVRRQLVDIMPRESLDNDINLGDLSSYVARRIFSALSRMFQGAHAIQIWLGECGSRISQSVTPEQVKRVQARRHGELKEPTKYRRKLVYEDDPSLDDLQFKSTVVWTTPLGMPVVQPYRTPKQKRIKTSMQDILVAIARASDPVSKRKQLQGFPPNFIHSLDATHMMLSALKCKELGLLFSAVHDSFWTHACDIPTMNRVLRDAFVRMHSEDIIGRLREEFMARYRGCLQVTSVPANSKLGKDIINLRLGKNRKVTFGAKPGFINTDDQGDELLEEYERQQLLKSDDEEEQQKGREMVTPASLFEEDIEAKKRSEERAPPLIHILGQTPADLENGVELSLEDEDQQAMEQASAVETDAELEADGLSGVIAPSQPEEDALTNPEAQTEVDEAVDQDPLAPHFIYDKNAKAKERGTKKKYPQRVAKVSFWVPISFPKAPAKGTFDVSSLKDSQYFFS